MLKKMRYFFQLFYYSMKNFIKNKDTYKAGSLTYYSLMALIPLLAICFAIAQGIGLQDLLEEELLSRFSEQKQILDEMIPLANNVLKQTKGGYLALFGFIFLAWSVIKVLTHLDYGFNHIWKQAPNRLSKRMGRYLVIIVILPLFLLTAGLINFIIINQLSERFLPQSFWQPITVFISYFLIWILFTFLYRYLPKEKVQYRAAIISGIIAGTLFQFLQGSYLFFQIALARLGALYGSFAALPLLLIWLQLSWIIVLLGAEISFVIQNMRYCRFASKGEHFSHKDKLLLSLWIVYHTIKAASHPSLNTSLSFFSKSLKIPSIVMKQFLEELVSCGLILERKGKKSEESFFQINCDIDRLYIKDVLDQIEKTSESRLSSLKVEKWDLLKEELEQFSKQIQKSKNNRLLKEL